MHGNSLMTWSFAWFWSTKLWYSKFMKLDMYPFSQFPMHQLMHINLCTGLGEHGRTFYVVNAAIQGGKRIVPP